MKRILVLLLGVVYLIFSSPIIAQDTGIRDTLRLDNAGPWNLCSDGDSLYSIEVWGFAEWESPATEIEGISIPMRLYVSGPGYIPQVHDSFIVIDTFVQDPGITSDFFIPHARSVVWDEFDEYEPHTLDTTYNAYLWGAVMIAAPIFPDGIVTKMGEYTLKIRHPERLPESFEITMDSAFYPPGGTFIYSVAGGFGGHAPVFISATIEVSNDCSAICGDLDDDGLVDINDVINLINYVYLGGPAPNPYETGDVNCDGKIDLLDVVIVLNYIFRGGPEPCSGCP